MHIVKAGLIVAIALLVLALQRSSLSGPAIAPSKIEKVSKTDAEWKKILTDDQYYILREKGTEPPFHNAFWNNHKQGTYLCAGCGLELFSSDFWDKYAPDNVIVTKDADGERDELLCARCGGHLGHVFDDGPRDHTGLRYCIDSGALKFVEKK
jgi:peptide-methionine (R)-S-oxide reductase